MPSFSRLTATDKEVHMDTVNGLSAAQVQQLLEPLQSGNHITQDSTGTYRLRHEWIRARLTQIFGFNGWGEENLQLVKIEDSFDSKTGEKLVVYGAKVRIILRNDDGSVRNFFDGSGAWGTTATRQNKATPWEVHSDAMNGACSVALCRAVINLGEQFGIVFYSDGLGTHTVGYSTPHNDLVSHLYGAADGDETPQIESVPYQYTEDPDQEQTDATA